MLTLKNIIDTLNLEQKEYNLDNKVIRNKIIKDCIKFNSNLYILNYNINFKGTFHNFISSILQILDKKYILTEKKYKFEKINILIKKMIIDYDNKNFYYKFNYNKNKKIKKNTVLTYLYEILNNKKIDNISILQQYIVDYFSINLFIIDEDGNNLFLSTKQFENKINKFVPVLILYKNKNNYYPIYHNNNNNGIFLYSKNKEFLKNLYNKNQVFFEKYKYDKLNLSELKLISEEQNLNIKHKSKTSGKIIFLKKSELLDALRENYIF